MTRQAGGCSVYPSWSPTRRPSTPITKRHSRRRWLTGRPDRCDPRRRGRWSRCDRSRPPAKHGTRSGDQDRHPEEQFQIGRTLPRNGGVTNVLQQGDLTELSFGYGSIDVVFPRWAVSPECHWKACDFGGPDPFLDAGRVFAVIQPAWTGRSDGTGCVRPRRAHRPAGWPGRCVAPSIRPCWRRWYPTTGARGWCSPRNRSR